MLTQDYISYVNRQLEQLLVYEGVFKEYAHTCKNIEKGNCYASESLERLRGYYAKNVLRFNKYVDTMCHLQAPQAFQTFNDTLIDGLKGISHGVSLTLMGIECDHVDHQYFDAGLTEQQKGKDEIETALTNLQAQPSAS